MQGGSPRWRSSRNRSTGWSSRGTGRCGCREWCSLRARSSRTRSAQVCGGRPATTTKLSTRPRTASARHSSRVGPPPQYTGQRDVGPCGARDRSPPSVRRAPATCPSCHRCTADASFIHKVDRGLMNGGMNHGSFGEIVLSISRTGGGATVPASCEPGPRRAASEARERRRQMLFDLTQRFISFAVLIRSSRRSGWAMLISSSARSQVVLALRSTAPYSVTT